MFFGKRKRFHQAVVEEMAGWVPTHSDRNLELFKVLMKFKIDDLYNAGATARLAAMALSSYYFQEVMRCAFVGDVQFFNYFGPHVGWFGACARHVLNNTTFLEADDATNLKAMLDLADNTTLPGNPSINIGALIREQEYLAKAVLGSPRN